MTNRAGNRYPLVSLASPVRQPPSRRHSSSSSRPAARWMAPSTPPPPSRDEFAALTIASTVSVVMSAWTARKLVGIRFASSGRLCPIHEDENAAGVRVHVAIDRARAGHARPAGAHPASRLHELALQDEQELGIVVRVNRSPRAGLEPDDLHLPPVGDRDVLDEDSGRHRRLAPGHVVDVDASDYARRVHFRFGSRAALVWSSRRTGVVAGASWIAAWFVSASRAIWIIASQNASSVSLASVSVGSIISASSTISGKYVEGA